MGKGMRRFGGCWGWEGSSSGSLLPASVNLPPLLQCRGLASSSSSHPRLQLCCSISLLGEDTKRNKQNPTHPSKQPKPTPSAPTHGYPPSPTPPVGVTSRTGCASLALGRGSRAGEAGGRSEPGPGRQKENRFCLRHGERRRGSVLRLPEPPAHPPAPLRSPPAGSVALRRGAGSSQSPEFLSFFLSAFLPSPSVGVIPAFSA